MFSLTKGKIHAKYIINTYTGKYVNTYNLIDELC